MIDRGRHNLLGVEINAVDYQAAVHAVMQAAESRTPFGVSAIAVHGVMSGVRDDAHRFRLNQLELIVPDGQPVRWSLNLLHHTQLRERVYGPQLMLEICEAAEQEGIPIYLYGGTSEMLHDLENQLSIRFPNLLIAGAQASRFRTLTSLEKREIISDIVDSGAQITFVGLGCPRQEVWAYEFKQPLEMPIVAVGAAFAFHSGHLSHAPALVGRLGLEWLYRLMREPKRLWQRYLFLNPYYLGLLFLQWSRLKGFDNDNSVPPAEEILYG